MKPNFLHIRNKARLALWLHIYSVHFHRFQCIPFLLTTCSKVQASIPVCHSISTSVFTLYVYNNRIYYQNMWYNELLHAFPLSSPHSSIFAADHWAVSTTWCLAFDCIVWKRKQTTAQYKLQPSLLRILLTYLQRGTWFFVFIRFRSQNPNTKKA